MAERLIRAGENLQQALDDAAPGDRLVLEAGATFTGPFTLGKKPGRQMVKVTSAEEGMARIVSPGFGESAFRTAPGGCCWSLRHLHIAKARPEAVVPDLVRFGEANQTAEEVPRDLVLWKCVIDGLEGGELRRCVTLNSAETRISYCEITNAKGEGYDTQAIGGWNGPGPYRIVGNTMSAAGEVVMFGGADPSIPGLVPSDIEIIGNRLTKPPEWRDGPWTIKNLLELKNARRVKILNNVLEYNWGAAQQGYALVLTPMNQDRNSPWSVVDTIEFRGNTVRHVAGGVQIRGRRDTERNAARITISENEFVIDGEAWGGGGIFLQVSECDELTVEKNRVWQTGNAVTVYGEPCQRAVFRDNVMMHGPYGVAGDETTPGEESIQRYFPGAIWENNVLVGRGVDD